MTNLFSSYNIKSTNLLKIWRHINQCFGSVIADCIEKYYILTFSVSIQIWNELTWCRLDLFFLINVIYGDEQQNQDQRNTAQRNQRDM